MKNEIFRSFTSYRYGTGSLTDFFGFVATLDKVLGSKNTQLGLRFKVHSVRSQI